MALARAPVVRLGVVVLARRGVVARLTMMEAKEGVAGKQGNKQNGEACVGGVDEVVLVWKEQEETVLGNGVNW
jgi:hypothetical protein